MLWLVRLLPAMMKYLFTRRVDTIPFSRKRNNAFISKKGSFLLQTCMQTRSMNALLHNLDDM
jgi:hypothetical protein